VAVVVRLVQATVQELGVQWLFLGLQWQLAAQAAQIPVAQALALQILDLVVAGVDLMVLPMAIQVQAQTVSWLCRGTLTCAHQACTLSWVCAFRVHLGRMRKWLEIAHHAQSACLDIS
jgi:hypothetical protein